MNVLGRDLDVEALARRVESMSATEQATFWRSIAEDAVKVLTAERDQHAGGVAALEQIDRETRHISGNAGRFGQIARDALAALGHSTIGGRYE